MRPRLPLSSIVKGIAILAVLIAYLTISVSRFVLLVGVFVTLIFVGYILLGIAATILYTTNKADQKANNVKLAITTLASNNVKPALFNTIEHTVENFGEYEIYCVLDEGSDLQAELERMDEISTVVVPTDYRCKAVAKGRAINYFIETEVEDDYWYGFLDDDNLILDDEFLYEIPYYEERGYGAMNPVLLPRPGRSSITFMADHIRTSDDMTIFRVFTGLVGKPYVGFHGELLCARGDLLREITFDRPTIVEDFSFAMELTKRGHKVWQSRTYVSILSPHSIKAFFKQRRRWFLGIASYIPKSPNITKGVVGSRTVLWSLGITGNWILFPLWVSERALALPTSIHYSVLTGGLVYALICIVGAYRLSGLKGILLFPLIPVCALMEHLGPVYALFNRDASFVVIDK